MKKLPETRVAPPAPDHLSEKSKALWVDLTGRRVVSMERLTLFELALGTLDLLDSLRGQISENYTVTTERTKALHINPLLKAYKENLQLFSKIWVSLGLNREQLSGFDPFN